MVKQNILIVDDSRFNIQILKDILQADYEIFSATSGKEALAIVMAQNIDLVLLDVVMPGMDGYQVCRQLKENVATQNIPVIFVSAMGETEDETKGLELGAIDYIIKPVSTPIVKARVKNHLELKKYRDILEKLSLLDGLTGIANRRHLDEMLVKEWRRMLRAEEQLSLLLVDIDYFKKYNDCYGHLKGDECLRKVANALKTVICRAGDLVARYGGEEFVVLLPATSQEGAVKVAERIKDQIADLQIPHEKSEISAWLTVSIGIASLQPEGNLLPAKLVGLADFALYKAKNAGRNRMMMVR